MDNLHPWYTWKPYIKYLNHANDGGTDVWAIKYWRNALTYLYKHLVDVDGILGTGFYEDGMDGVGVVLGILLWHLPVNTSGTLSSYCCTGLLCCCNWSSSDVFS